MFTVLTGHVYGVTGHMFTVFTGHMFTVLTGHVYGGVKPDITSLNQSPPVEIIEQHQAVGWEFPFD